MPAPDTAACIDAVTDAFRSRAIRHPLDWQGHGRQFPQAFSEQQLRSTPNPRSNLFRQASLHQYHVDGSRDLGRLFERYINGICTAICEAIDFWLQQAMIRGVSINGATGILPPGGLRGPILFGPIMERAPVATEYQALYSRAIARAFSDAWHEWQQSVQGTLPYPSLAAWPSPSVSGVANTPVPLQALSRASIFTGPCMYPRYRQCFGNDAALHSRPLFYAIAFGFVEPLQAFLASTHIGGVEACGPVPSWNPPAVNAGPVAGGTGEGRAGCIR